jgi:hypothetical protein
LNWDHETDFSKVKTYGWMAGQQPLPNEANHIRMMRAIENALEKKGLQAAAFEDPHVLILYRAGVQQRVGGKSSTGTSWDPTNIQTIIDFHREKKGSLTIEMYDSETNKIVWRAQGSEVLPKPDKMEKSINKAVQSLMRHYPPGSTPEPRQR